MADWLSTYRADLAALAFSLLLFGAYRAVQGRRAHQDPSATLQGWQSTTRETWVAEMLATGNGILGVQTLRNALMGAVFFASNTMFLVMGTLSLTGNAGGIAEAWSAFGGGSADGEIVVQAKLLLLLLTLLGSFFNFVNAIRLFVHASVSIATPSSVPGRVAAQIDRAWHYQGRGVRGYYFAAPIVFWCFGPLWLVVASVLSIALMYTFDDARAWR